MFHPKLKTQRTNIDQYVSQLGGKLNCFFFFISQLTTLKKGPNLTPSWSRAAPNTILKMASPPRQDQDAWLRFREKGTTLTGCKRLSGNEQEAPVN